MLDTSWKEHVFQNNHNLKGKRVVIRVDWNLPVNEGVITDASRFEVTIPFIKELSLAGAKIILLTHYGEKGESLKQIADYAIKHLPFVSFVDSFDFNELRKKTNELADGDAMLLENVRMWEGETDNLPSLAKEFSSLGNIFINDAFSVSHRNHASVVGIAENMLSYFGPTFVRELENLSKILEPEKPALLIVGGAKISTKLSLIERYLNQGIHVFVGGAMVHNIWVAEGIKIGKSLYDHDYKLSTNFINNPLLVTPIDVVLDTGEKVSYDKIPEDANVVDVGEDTVKILEKIIDDSKTVIVNGPLGLYEKGWIQGSEKILNKLAHSTATTYIGGGDTVALTHSLHLLTKMNFVSLGGGAMLDFLTFGTLPGINAVTKK